LSANKVGLVASAFDLLHTGHILMLKEAKSVCDYLVVCLHLDPSQERKFKNKPVQDIVERQAQLKATRYVDEIIVYETEEQLLEIIKSAHFDIRIIGEDYLGKDFTGKEFCLENNIEIYYAKRRHSYSSSGLIERIRNV
jgi:glycerol-3-phosphate cytidylyltransferase